jgi:ferredoxin
MVQEGKRLIDNAPGKFYVTDMCDGCGLCFSKALQNFMYSNDSSFYYVYQQPMDEREEEDIREAMSVCPQDCIKDDGELVV